MTDRQRAQVANARKAPGRAGGHQGKSDIIDTVDFVGRKLRWQLALLCDLSLSTTAQKFGALLMHDFDERNGFCAWRAQASVSESGEEGDSYRKRTGFHVRTIQLAAKELTDKGWIVVEQGRGRGHSNRYWPVLEKADNAPPFCDEKAVGSPPLGAEMAAVDSPISGTMAKFGDVNGESTAAQLLQDSNNSPLPPSAASAGSSQQSAGERTACAADGRSQASGSPGQRPPRLPRELFDQVRAATGGDPFKVCDGYLTWCLWDESRRTLHPPSGFARAVIDRDLKAQLKQFGMTLGEPIGGER